MYKYFSTFPDSLIEIAGALILFFVSMYFYQNLKSSSVEIFYYSLLTFLFEIINNTLSYFVINNHKIYLVYYLLESVLFAFIYLKNFENPFSKKILFLLIGCILLIISNNFSKNMMDNYSISSISACYIIISTYAFYQILYELKIESLFKSTYFWFNTANIIYFSGRLFLFLFISEVLNDKNLDLSYLWSIATLLILIHRILISISIFYIEKQKLQTK